VRLDHLLSKEHHEKRPRWGGVSRVESVVCSGRGLGAVNNISRLPGFLVGGGGIAGTLLGPEATPCGLGVLSPRLVVGCGV
jgi:hypothetical protein